MTKFVKRFKSIMACIAIMVLSAVIITVWVQFSQGAFSTKQFEEEVNATTTIGQQKATRQFNTTRHKEFIERTHLDDIETDTMEFVKPLKVSPTPDENIRLESETPSLRHHSGHFRHKQTDVWDLHPHYEIEAFGQKMTLELDYNDKFVAPNLHIVTHFHDTENIKHDSKLSGCFYTGKIKGEIDSSVAVSLCNGMTGYIRTRDSSYYIEPAQAFSNATSNSLIHRMKRLPHPIKESNDVMAGSMEFYENSENLTIIEDDFYQETAQIPRDHVIKKRAIQDQIEGTCDAVEQVVWRRSVLHEVPEESSRKPRNAEWKSTYRMSDESFVKVVVVADKSMVKYHSDVEELTHYILMLMSHVSFLFKDETIGNPISVSVIEIRVLNHDDFSNTYSSDMLLKFCNWTKYNILDRANNVAILLTRNTICRNESEQQRCTTLGVAGVNSMCQSGCAIVRDKGLASSFTIAHELGHILSMPHDEDEKCRLLNRDVSITSIMSKQIKKETKPFTWSPCSKYFLTDFLDSDRATCVKLPPINNYIRNTYTALLPGDKFDLDTQCEYEFGPGHKVCLTGIPCEHLFCTTNSTDYPCTSTFSPWADGTRCGDDRECFNGECRPKQEYIPVDGGWGPWQGYGPCSRTCGGGIRVSQRHCNSPAPKNGGSYCIGQNVRYESCNIEDCDAGSTDYRAKQCGEFNGNNLGFPNIPKDVQWYPKYTTERPDDYCRLFCLPDKLGQPYRLRDKVADGTKCGPTGYGICVSGICKPGGCDNVLDSTVVLDDCGICGGDNSRCQEITGQYNKPAETSGYNRVVRIPKGSSNLNITQDSYPFYVDQNYLVLIDGETGVHLLNGNNMANMDGRDLKFGNVDIKYSGGNFTLEWITSSKNRKLPKDLVVSVLSGGKLTSPNIRYRYVIDIQEAPSYAWRLYQKEWSKCSSICEGKQYRKPVCVEIINNKEVNKGYCDNMEDSLTQKQECNTHCELTWNIASKSACSPQCGKGIRKIYYNCMKVYKKKPNRSEIVNEKHCTILASPPAWENCNTVCNSTRWHYSPWTECSKTCGGGTQRRTAKCVDDSYTPTDDSYCNNSEMVTEQICNTEHCPVWTFGDTSSCSAPCGGGYKNITYYCVLDGRIYDNHACDITTKPPEREPCNEQACGRWAPTNAYHSCSVTCGEGIERRQFVCKKFDSYEILDENYCRGQSIPHESRACYRPNCDLVSSNERKTTLKDDFDNFIKADPFTSYKNYKWVPENWSTCSQSCGDAGRSKQLFRCVNEFGSEDDSMCDTNRRPNNVVKCNNFPCPKWKTSDWGASCDANCERLRHVVCIDNSGTVTGDSRCDQTRKPEARTKCKLTECPNAVPKGYFDSSEIGKRYRWKVGSWKQCSNSCGKGTRRRHIECEDALNEIAVVDSYCRNLRKPKIMKNCEKYACSYAWIESYWSDCSASCGTGVKKRNITCHKVHRGGLIDPTPLPDLYQNKIHHKNYCSVRNKPPNIAKCILSNCGDEYIWHSEPWQECSHKCTRKGRQVRTIDCVRARTKEKVPRTYCPRHLKPPRKRKCNQWRCNPIVMRDLEHHSSVSNLYRSCKDVKLYARKQENNDYVLTVRQRQVTVYCYKMDTPEPLEYITLHPDKFNFAEIYDRRLMDVRSCPYNGKRRDNCNCDQIGPNRSGLTKFWKVRVNLTSLQIIGNDFTFSKQLRGVHVPFGTAGDCYSSVEGCAQGRFEVDLTHTSFKLARDVRWKAIGPNSSADIRRTETSASGKCGGYCGNCMPDPNVGLAVEIT